MWRSHKGVNGLKQAARARNAELTATLRKCGFQPSKSDPSFIKGTPPNATFILCYVDDLLIAGNKNSISQIKKHIASSFKCEDMGEANLFLGMKVLRNRSKNELWVGQPHYALEIVEKFGLSDCKPRKTPMDANVSLSKDSGEPNPEVLEKYQEIVDCLLYLTGCTSNIGAQTLASMTSAFSHQLIIMHDIDTYRL